MVARKIRKIQINQRLIPKTRVNLGGSMLQAFAKPSRRVSDRMRQVRSTGTGLEIQMERILAGMSVDYEVQPRLPGRPDFRVSGTNVLIFCDSSFWHGRRIVDLTGASFKRNKGFWKNKIIQNRARDRSTNRKLRAAGWKVLRVWDTSISKRPELVAARIEEAIK